MSLVQYNSVKLELVKVNTFQQRAVYTDDDVDYLYTHYYLSCRCVFHPEATAIFGQDAALSIATLRASLLAPRKTLTFAVGGQTILKSPNLAGATVDANNGPHPIACNIIEIHGAKTVIVEFTIETWQRECSTANALMVHRWESSHDYSEDYLCTRTINGMAVLRSDVLQVNNLKADNYRRMLSHPIQNNSHRVHVNVRADSDGVTYHYTIVDQEQPLVIPGNMIVRISGHYTSGFDTTAITAPLFYESMSVDLWGRREATRNALCQSMAEVFAAWAVDFGATGTGRLGKFLAKSTLTLDIIGKHVHGEWARICSGMAMGYGKAIFGKNGISGDIAFPEEIPGIAVQNLRNTSRAYIRPGASAEQLITQALTTPCGLPSTTPNPAAASDVPGGNTGLA